MGRKKSRSKERTRQLEIQRAAEIRYQQYLCRRRREERFGRQSDGRQSDERPVSIRNFSTYFGRVLVTQDRLVKSFKSNLSSCLKKQEEEKSLFPDSFRESFLRTLSVIELCWESAIESMKTSIASSSEESQLYFLIAQSLRMQATFFSNSFDVLDVLKPLVLSFSPSEQRQIDKPLKNILAPLSNFGTELLQQQADLEKTLAGIPGGTAALTLFPRSVGLK